MTGHGPADEFLRFLDQGRFMIQRGRASGACFFYPRSVEPGTGATDIEWIEASGRGTVYSTTVIRQRPPKEDYNLALIDLAEGPRMVSRVIGLDPAQVAIGMEVRSSIIREDEQPVLVFEPVDRA